MEVKFEILGGCSVRSFVVRETRTANNGETISRVRKCTLQDLVICVEGGEVSAEAYERHVGFNANSAEAAERETTACNASVEWSNDEPFELEDSEEEEPTPTDPSEGEGGEEPGESEEPSEPTE